MDIFQKLITWANRIDSEDIYVNVTTLHFYCTEFRQFVR